MTEIGLGDAQPQPQPRHLAAESINEPASVNVSETPVDNPQPLPEPERVNPPNPYAPTGWRAKSRTEFDLQLPSGQLCRVARLERDDLLRLNLMEYLNTFTPMLMDSELDDDERQEQMKDAIREDPEALTRMLSAVDKVVMAVTVRPKVTQERKKVNYGTEKDWANPNFTATVHLDDIDTFERFYIFGAAFGRSMDDLKSILEQAESMADMGDV